MILLTVFTIVALLVLDVLNFLYARNLNRKIDAVLEYAEQLAKLANSRADMLNSMYNIKEEEENERHVK